jgi:nicotinate-nucleotide adenylyltransferase
MKLGIYGGAFNPVHYGHLRTAEEVRDLLSLNKVLFIPSGKTPFDKPDLEKSGHRYEMVKRAIKGNRHFDVSDVEINRRGKSYTVDTIMRLRRECSGSELFFILGIDAFLDMQYWKKPDVLIKSTNVVVISRPGYTFSDLSTLPYLEGISRKALRELDKGREGEVSFDISGYQKGYLCNVTELNISASRIRDLVSIGKEIKYLLPDSVKSYIISNKLYRKH